MKQEYTKGPWKITMAGRTKDGGAHQHQIGTPEKTVAYAWVPISGDKDQSFHEHNANARLIASAPELLETLEYILYAHQNNGNGASNCHATLGCQCLGKAISAIKNAKGE